MKKDVIKLIDIWEQLHEIGGELDEIEKRHPKVSHLIKALDSSKATLLEIAHIVFLEAHALEKEKEKDEN